jgi:acyl-coenzyme A thioesterase 13
VSEKKMILPMEGPGAYQRPDLSLPVKARVQALFDALTSGPAPIDSSKSFTPYDMLPLKYTRLISASEPKGSQPGSTVWSFTSDPTLCNRGGNLHGGCAATLLDSLTSTALLTIAKPGFLDGGHVSRTLSCTYLRPVPMGEECTVECWVVSGGKRTAHVGGQIKLKDGRVAVTCVHDKAVLVRGEVEKMAKEGKKAKL